MDTDEDQHVLFAFEGEHPDHERVYDQLPDEGGIGSPVVSTDEVTGELRTAPGDGVVGVSDLFRFDLRVQQYAVVDTPGKDTSQAERVEALLDLVKAIYRASDPRPGFVYGIQHGVEDALQRYDDPAPADAASLAEDRINHAVWLNLFPPLLVDTCGRERLLDAPAWHTEELDDGAILVVAYEDPLAYEPHKDLNEHLWLEDLGF